MDELKEYLDNHKGFRLTKEMIEKILQLADEAENQYWEDAQRYRDLCLS